MPLSTEEFVEITEFLEDVVRAEHRLTEWEKEFVTSIRARYTQYDVNLIMSEKQFSILRRIASSKVYTVG